MNKTMMLTVPNGERVVLVYHSQTSSGSGSARSNDDTTPGIASWGSLCESLNRRDKVGCGALSTEGGNIKSVVQTENKRGTGCHTTCLFQCAESPWTSKNSGRSLNPERTVVGMLNHHPRPFPNPIRGPIVSSLHTLLALQVMPNPSSPKHPSPACSNPTSNPANHMPEGGVCTALTPMATHPRSPSSPTPQPALFLHFSHSMVLDPHPHPPTRSIFPANATTSTSRTCAHRHCKQHCRSCLTILA